MTKIEGDGSSTTATVSIEVAPDDTAASLSSKLVAAGASAPDDITFKGQAVTGTLADCGLDGSTTIQAAVITKSA